MPTRANRIEFDRTDTALPTRFVPAINPLSYHSCNLRFDEIVSGRLSAMISAADTMPKAD
jgi:hypothetical protein